SDVVAMKAALERLDAHAAELRRQHVTLNPAALRERLASELAAAAVADKPLDATGVDEVLDAERRAAALETLISATTVARNDLATGLESARFDERIVECLDRAFHEVLDVVRSVAPALAGVDVELPESVIGTGASTQKGWSRLTAAAERMNAIRTAQRITTGHARDAATFSVFADPVAVIGPDRWQSHQQTGFRPWPDSRLSFLIWLATSPEAAAGRPAILTVAERERLAIALREANRGGNRELGATIAV
ncbi:MAG: hypothetical protein ACR2I5_03655, partial [Candidatus Limnocylindria bacterium]